MIDEGKALDIIGKYHAVLQKTGYVKHSIVLRLLIYVFLLDFVDYTHTFYDEKDYNVIARAMDVLFSRGGCLMPYPVMCTNRVVLGRPEYMGTMKVRKTEDHAVDKDGRNINYQDRSTEDDRQRTV